MIEKARELAQIETMPYETQEIEEEELPKENRRQTIGNKTQTFERTTRGTQTNHRGKQQ